MKKLLAILMSLSLLIPAIYQAQAQDNQRNRGNRPAAGGPNRAGRAAQGRQGRGGRPQAGRRGGRGGRPAAVRGPVRGGQFRRGGRSFNRIRGPAFVWPRGFGYRRWGVGGILPSVFLASPFFFAGWASMGLQPPPPGFQWVRQGPDVVLVNLRTGQIIDVAYGVFY